MKQGFNTENQGKKRLIDWLATPLFLSAFLALLIAVEFLFCLRLLLPGISYDRLYGYISSGTLWALKTFAGLKFEVSGKLPESNLPLVIVSNHQSMFDIPFLNVALSPLRLRYVAKIELAKGIPAISRALRNGEHALIDRNQGASAVAEIEKMAKDSVLKNFNITLFPEGTRSRDGKVRNFRVGGIEKIVDTLGEVDLLPVAISGSWKINRFSLFPVCYGEHVSVKILEPVRARKNDLIDEKGKSVREAIISVL